MFERVTLNNAGAATVEGDCSGIIEEVIAQELETPREIDVFFVHKEVFVEIFFVAVDGNACVFESGSIIERAGA